MDVSGLVVESIEAVPAGSMDAAAYDHGMPELAVSYRLCCNCEGVFLSEDWDRVEV